ncbi:unnamed protein product, partial [Ectocarpus sp. 13 AM-2016]
KFLPPPAHAHEGHHQAACYAATYLRRAHGKRRGYWGGTLSHGLQQTSSSSSRFTDGGPPAPDYGWAATQPYYPPRFNEVVISYDGSILSSQPPSTTAAPKGCERIHGGAIGFQSEFFRNKE